MITTLEKFGLSEKEAKVYLASLELGPQTVQIIAKKAGVNRVTTYVVLESLMKTGLISTYEKGKKTFFAAESPRNLDNLVKREEANLQSKKQELQNLLPELEAIYNVSGPKPTVRFFEGKEGFKSLQKELEDATKKGDISYTFTNLDDVYSLYPDYKEKQTADRIKQNRWLKQIYNSSQGPIRKTIDKENLRESRYVPRSKFPIDISLNIIPNKMLRIATYKNGFYGISIKNPQIVNSIKTLYDLAWEAATKYNNNTKHKEKEKERP